MCEPQHLRTLWASADWYRDSFTFFLLSSTEVRISCEGIFSAYCKFVKAHMGMAPTESEGNQTLPSSVGGSLKLVKKKAGKMQLLIEHKLRGDHVGVTEKTQTNYTNRM
jgi:hypothetical protein